MENSNLEWWGMADSDCSNKNRLQSIIILNIKPDIQVSLTRLAELLEFSTKLTGELPDGILNITPALGEYHQKELVFIRTLQDNNNGTEKMGRTFCWGIS